VVTKRINALLLCCFCVSACAADPAREPSPSAKDTASAPLPPAAHEDEPSTARAEPSIVSDRPILEEPVLLWGFEPASPDCNGWPTSGAEAIRATPARSGNYSCKVCADGTSVAIAISHDLGALEAGHYVFNAWVRRRAVTAAPSEAFARVDADTHDGLVQATAPTVTIRDAWDLLEVPFDLATSATNVRVSIGAPTAEAERCLFVDDVMLRAE